MDYEKAEKRLKLKFKKERMIDGTQETEYYTREYNSEIGIIKVNHNRGSKYCAFIHDYDGELLERKVFAKKKHLIDYLVSNDAEYVQKYWE